MKRVNVWIILEKVVVNFKGINLCFYVWESYLRDFCDLDKKVIDGGVVLIKRLKEKLL